MSVTVFELEPIAMVTILKRALVEADRTGDLYDGALVVMAATTTEADAGPSGPA